MSQILFNATGMTLDFDRVLDDSHLPFRMYAEMRVVYDSVAARYVVAVNLYYQDTYSNQMGLCSVAVGVDGTVLWVRPFPAAHGSLTGVQSQPYGLAYAAPFPGAERRYVIAGHSFWTWMLFVARTDENGNALWSGNFTDNAALQNNAGEYIVATRDGGYAVYVDSQSWGPGSTGGNFAIMMLGEDASRSPA